MILLGRAYKPGIGSEDGSPARLVARITSEHFGWSVKSYEPYEGHGLIPTVDPTALPAACYFLGTAHRLFTRWKFPPGSTVIDPFGIIADQPDVRVVRVARAASRVLRG